MFKISHLAVSTIREVHFMNSVRLYPGKYSCAIDSFLEIWFNKLAYTNLALHDSNEFFALLRLAKAQYDEIKNSNSCTSETSLVSVRELVWEYLRLKCPSMRPMDCNAVFSEIFQRQVFGYLTENQKDVVVSKFFPSGVCSKCHVETESTVEVLLHYIGNKDQNYWPRSIIENKDHKYINCQRCNHLTLVENYRYLLSEILFVEIAVQVNTVLEFATEPDGIDSITLGESTYSLHAITRNKGMHFSCAVRKDSYWLYYDDLLSDVLKFEKLTSLFQHCEGGWFFFVNFTTYFIRHNM